MFSILFVTFALAIHSCLGNWIIGESKFCEKSYFLEIPCQCEQQQVNCQDKSFQDLTRNFSLPDGTWEVDFSRNQITELKKAELKNIWPKDFSIRAVDFSRNRIENVEQNSFELLSSLEVLDLSRNNLSELPEKVFEKLYKLETLILSYNHLKIVRREWFNDLTNLIRLDLSYNPLGFQDLPIYVDLFSPLKQLRYLNLANCSSGMMPLNIFENNTKLTELSLAQNPFEEIPTTQLYSLRASLEFLDLSQIDVRTLRNHEFHGMFFLKKLLLNDLRFLEQIEPLAFHNLKNLEVLECQNNKQLTKIDPFAFYDNLEKHTSPNKISQVYLNNNGLSTISKFLLDFKNAEIIQIEGNPIDCNCEMEWLAMEYRSEIPALEFSEFLVCSAPEKLKDFPIRHLQKVDFECPDETSFSWMSTALLASSLVVLSLLATLLGYFLIVKKHFPNVLPKNYQRNKSGTRMVFHFERLFRRSHPKIPNPARYQQIRRGESMYSQTSVFEEIPQQPSPEQEQPQHQKEQRQQEQTQQIQQQESHHYNSSPVPITHSNIVEVHQVDDMIVNDFP